MKKIIFFAVIFFINCLCAGADKDYLLQIIGKEEIFLNKLNPLSWGLSSVVECFKEMESLISALREYNNSHGNFSMITKKEFFEKIINIYTSSIQRLDILHGIVCYNE